MDNFFETRVYAITGATSGIGEAVAMELAKNGARVLALGRNEEKLKNLLANLEGKNHSYRLFDSNRLETCEEAIKSGVEEMGKLSGFVHSAGVAGGTLLRDLDFDKLNKVLQINLICFFAFAKAVCKMGRYEKGTMSVIGLSSISAFDFSPSMSMYIVSKVGLDAASKVFAKEYAKKRIRFNTIAPGYVDTPMVDDFTKRVLGKIEQENRIKEMMPLGIIEPKEIADLALFLLSDKSKKITGQTIRVTAGH